MLSEFDAVTRIFLKKMLEGVQHSYALEMAWATAFDEMEVMARKGSENFDTVMKGPEVMGQLIEAYKEMMPMSIHAQMRSQSQLETLYTEVIGEEASKKLSAYMQEANSQMLYNISKIDTNEIIELLYGKD